MAQKKVDIVVLKPFLDKTDHATMFKPGDELSFVKDRADDVINRGLAELKKVDSFTEAAEKAEAEAAEKLKAEAEAAEKAKVEAAEKLKAEAEAAEKAEAEAAEKLKVGKK